VRTTWLLLCVAVLCGLFTGLRGGLFSVAMWRLNVRIRRALFGSLLAQEIGFYDTAQTGARARACVCVCVCVCVCACARAVVRRVCVRVLVFSSVRGGVVECLGRPPPHARASPSAAVAAAARGNTRARAHAGEISSRLSADTTTVSDSISLNLNVLVRSATQVRVVGCADEPLGERHTRFAAAVAGVQQRHAWLHHAWRTECALRLLPAATAASKSSPACSPADMRTRACVVPAERTHMHRRSWCWCSCWEPAGASRWSRLCSCPVCSSSAR
jgi:hypothetical protein